MSDENTEDGRPLIDFTDVAEPLDDCVVDIQHAFDPKLDFTAFVPAAGLDDAPELLRIEVKGSTLERQAHEFLLNAIRQLYETFPSYAAQMQGAFDTEGWEETRAALVDSQSFKDAEHHMCGLFVAHLDSIAKNLVQILLGYSGGWALRDSVGGGDFLRDMYAGLLKSVFAQLDSEVEKLRLGVSLILEDRAAQ